MALPHEKSAVSVEKEALADPADETCGRLLVGRGGDTWDPVCTLPAGHKEPCDNPEAIR